MPRLPKPWYRKDRSAWFVTIKGVRHNLGKNKKEAFTKFHALMNAPETPPVSLQSFVAVADAFLDWVHKNQAKLTFEWYRFRIERFCRRYPDLNANDLRPYHVQQWVDSYEVLGRNSRRNHMRAIKRCMRWAQEQGYVDRNMISHLKMPGAVSREVSISRIEFEYLCSFIVDSNFLMLCQTAFDTGCRPQEIVAVEARHFDEENSRWIFPTGEAKGKKKPRIVYLSPASLVVTKTLAKRYPSGPLFRNSIGSKWTKNSVNCAFSRLQCRMGRAKIAISEASPSEWINEQLILLNGNDVFDRESKSNIAKLKNRLLREQAPRYSLYAFRHSWATRALQSGVDALTVAVLMGHNDPSTLSRVYQHIAHSPEYMSQQALRATGAR